MNTEAILKDIDSTIEHFENQIAASNDMIYKYGTSLFDSGKIEAYEDAIAWLKAVKEKHANS